MDLENENKRTATGNNNFDYRNIENISKMLNKETIDEKHYTMIERSPSQLADVKISKESRKKCAECLVR